MHKNQSGNSAVTKRQKREKRTRKSQKKAKPGAFWVLEEMGTVENGSNQMRKPGKLGENHGTDLSRLPPRSGLDAAHRAAGPHDTHRRRACGRTSLPNPTARQRKKSGTAEAIPDFFGRGRRTRTLGTRFWSGCGNTPARAGEERCYLILPASPREGGAGLVLRGIIGGRNRWNERTKDD